MFGANLVILAQICDKVSCGEGKVYGQTDRRTYASNNNTASDWKTIGKNWYRFHYINGKDYKWLVIYNSVALHDRFIIT